MQSKDYKHTQFGWMVFLFSFLPGAIILILALSNKYDERLKENFLLGAFILFSLLLLFHSLKIHVADETITVSFGIGLIRKTISIVEIENCIVKKQRGITLWSIFSFNAVEIIFKNKSQKLRIGTDNPEELCEAINERMKILNQTETEK